MGTFNYNFVDDSYTLPSGSYDFEMKDIIYIPPDPPDPLPAYYGFSFRDAGYSAPSPQSFDFTLGSGTCPDQWIEHEYDQWPPDPNIAWDECEDPFTFLKQIWTDGNYVYAATTDGLNIIDLLSELAYAHITYKGGFNSVWADDNKVYLATSTSGVKYIDKACISGSTNSPYELAVCLRDYLNEPDILSNQVRYIHGNNSHMIMSTASGINYRGPDLYYQKAEGFTKLSRKVFITSSGRMYYTTWDGTKWRVNVKYANNQNWTEPDKSYETGTFLISAGVDILDIFVTEGTSDSGASNTIFIATTSGIFVIDEELDEGETYYTE
jgi:hypothetical protein